MLHKKEIVYPYFLECAALCSDDSFWEEIFILLSKGIPPPGTFINKGYLCCMYKNKEFSYKLERKEAKVLKDELYDILNTKAGILSLKEKSKQRIEFEEYGNKIKRERKTWSDIHKKDIKEYSIDRYILYLMKKLNLTRKETLELYNIISIAMHLKLITPKDIKYSDGAIRSIEGVSVVNDQIVINHDIYDLSKYTMY